MELSKNYIPGEVEEKWYRHWMEKKYFNSTPDERPPFTVVIPPPNVTGVLHMGHTLNETVQDILVRKARMSGFNACWVPGSDHASIATEARVVDMLKREKGIDKNNLSREEFLKYAFEWKEKYGNIIYSQIAKLGCSVDWDRVSFTMDDHYYQAVIKVFVDLYRKGLIYRGARMINWDPEAKTALSDEEVEYKDVTGRLYYIKYQIVAESPDEAPSFLVIATQRPETIMGDVAVCANPGDERYMSLKGKKVLVPLIDREIPVIFDEYVDKEFGTGILKITPAHDINDYNIGLKHRLGVIDTLNEDGTLSPEAGIFVGEDRFVAREKIVQELRNRGLLLKEEEYPTRLGYSQRSHAVAEPKISTQWFVKMQQLAGPALDEVISGDIRIHPHGKFNATYKYWLENVKDWCISRQLWWGQQIPAWYDEDGKVFVGETEEDARRDQPASDGRVLTRDGDVLDTWFSSWLWPIEVFRGITEPDSSQIDYYYPSSVLVTGQDIIFFWVARMVMAGMEYRGKKPFSDVYFTGMVRDKMGRKMSKSLGNSPDLLLLIHEYGADAVRFGIMIAAPAGNDLLFDESSLEQGKFFNNKLWNALKLLKIWEEQLSIPGEEIRKSHEKIAERDTFALAWFRARLNEARKEVDLLMSQFRLNEALKTIYSLIWDDYCSWFLEWIKPEFSIKMNTETLDQASVYYDELLQMLHPFMPFITEEIYHLLKERKDDLIIKQFEPIEKVSPKVLLEGDKLKNVISSVRDIRNKNHIKPKEPVTLFIETNDPASYESIKEILAHQTRAAAIVFNELPASPTIMMVVGNEKIHVLSNAVIDTNRQKEKLVKDLAYLKGFLMTVEKKLNNDRFVQHANAEVIELERKKKKDTEEKIKMIEQSLSAI